MKAKGNHPSLDRIRELLSYDPETGVFRARKMRNRLAPGDIVGWLATNGYRIITLDHQRYRAHHLAWFWVVGKWPSELDHRDGNRDNNRFSNLRECTRSLNHANRKIQSNNVCGLKGVHQHPDGRWRAQIRKSGQRFHLGLFQTKEEAHAAYLVAARDIFGDFARGG